MTICIVVGMEQEAELVRRACPKAIIVISAGNATLLAEKLAEAIAAGANHIISVGICGGLNPSLRAGDIVIGTSIIYGLSQITSDLSWCDRLFAALVPKPPSIHVMQGWFTWSETAVARLSDKAALRKTTGGDAVDEETFIAGSIAATKGISFTALRAVSDSADFELPPAALVKLQADGNENIGAILDSIAGNPWQIPELVELAGSTATAMANLKLALTKIGPNFMI